MAGARLGPIVMARESSVHGAALRFLEQSGTARGGAGVAKTASGVDALIAGF
jgi:hypothetical protein